ncbi:unnamed protein product [Caenorhabditis auriculariae]|uniref:Uncharacterized protein n=1 Tax=Caenorhabditis auriculariae TaxID=2777116 RepID=A0A8S1HYP5_9PELO|nr:unnamed protein product [Caenorhabditis auriculariae]
MSYESYLAAAKRAKLNSALSRDLVFVYERFYEDNNIRMAESEDIKLKLRSNLIALYLDDALYRQDVLKAKLGYLEQKLASMIQEDPNLPPASLDDFEAVPNPFKFENHEEIMHPIRSLRSSYKASLETKSFWESQLVNDRFEVDEAQWMATTNPTAENLDRLSTSQKQLSGSEDCFARSKANSDRERAAYIEMVAGKMTKLAVLEPSPLTKSVNYSVLQSHHETKDARTPADVSIEVLITQFEKLTVRSKICFIRVIQKK